MRRTNERKAVDLLVRFHLGRRRRQPQHPTRRRDHDLTRDWGWQHNILGFGISEKRTAGQRQRGARCLTIFVKRKLPNHRLSERERIPPTLRLESVGESVLTDLVVISGMPRAQAQRDAVFRPLQPGANVGHSSGLEGTLGLLVQQGGTGPALMLSCSHVLARSGNGASVGDAIVQPLVATFNPNSQVGTLTGTFTVFSESGTFDEDVALANVTLATPTPPAIPNMADSGAVITSCSTLTSDQFDVGMQVARDGIGSQSQTGETIAFQSAWSNVDMPFVGFVNFTGLVAYSASNDEGDSGAAVVQSLPDGTTQVVGLHVAGIKDAGVSLFQPIGPIMKNHNLTLFTG